MSKELELLQEIKDIVVLFKNRNTIYMGGEKSETFNHKNTIGNEFKGIFEIIEQALKRLETIDNANPSEALKFVDKILGYFGGDDVQIETMTLVKSNVLKIKQALLKAQEPKSYLKWEDLEFGKTTHKLKAKMNGNLYRIEWYIDGMGSKVVCLDKYITNDYLIHSACIKDYNQQFFNDLRLERVE